MLSQDFRQDSRATAPFASALVLSPPDEECLLADAMKTLGTTLTVDRNQGIYAEEDPASCFYAIVSGVVRTCRFLEDGRRQIGSFHFAGDTFGFSAGATHGLSAEAVEPSRLIVVKRTVLSRAAARDAELATALWNAATEELGKAQEHLVLLGSNNATERTLAFLRSMARGISGADILDIPMSRQDIADYLGLRIETVSRTITHLEEKGVIALESARRLRVRSAI